MRITSGKNRGHKITIPSGIRAGMRARPTAAKVRQALLNILANLIKEARFLDLFAGSGLIGIEALSRGAASLVAVEENKKLVYLLQQNLNKLNCQGKVICGNVIKVIPTLETQGFDIIFADPPYQSSLASDTLALLDRWQLLANGGIIAIEHPSTLELPKENTSLVAYDKRQYGQTVISFFQRK